jgi:hypothetical protein
MKPFASPTAESPSRPPRVHMTSSDWARGILYLATVVVFAASPLLIVLLIFSLFFNAITIHLTLFAVGALVFLRGFTEYRNRLTVTGTPTAKADSAAIGLVELSGRAYVDNPSEAPVTRTMCALWNLEVHQKGEKSFRWAEFTWNRKLRRSSRDLETLQLGDDTGRVLVWARGAEIIPVSQVWHSNSDASPPESLLKLVAAMGLQWPSRWSRYPMKVTEERIEQSGPLYVMGTLAERRQIPPMAKGLFAALLDKWASPELGDEAAAARTFSGTFDYARKIGLRWCARQIRPAGMVRSPPPDVDQHQVLVWKGEQRRPFIISGVLEPQALRALSRRAWGYLLGGAGLMAWMLWTFLEKLAGNMHW